MLWCRSAGCLLTRSSVKLVANINTGLVGLHVGYGGIPSLSAAATRPSLAETAKAAECHVSVHTHTHTYLSTTLQCYITLGVSVAALGVGGGRLRAMMFTPV